LPGLAILPILVSQIARIRGMSHGHPARFGVFNYEKISQVFLSQIFQNDLQFQTEAISENMRKERR
jgi:hypothetical protein